MYVLKDFKFSGDVGSTDIKLELKVEAFYLTTKYFVFAEKFTINYQSQ
jgi:hypothetical protein